MVIITIHVSVVNRPCTGRIRCPLPFEVEGWQRPASYTVAPGKVLTWWVWAITGNYNELADLSWLYRAEFFPFRKAHWASELCKTSFGMNFYNNWDCLLVTSYIYWPQSRSWHWKIQRLREVTPIPWLTHQSTNHYAPNYKSRYPICARTYTSNSHRDV